MEGGALDIRALDAKLGAILGLASLMFSGCGQPSSGGSDPTQEAFASESMEQLLSINWTYTNQSPQPFASEIPIDEFYVTKPYDHVDIVVERKNRPSIEVFASQLVVTDPTGDSMTYPFDTANMIHETIETPAQGTWKLGYGTDELQPGGETVLQGEVLGVHSEAT